MNGANFLKRGFADSSRICKEVWIRNPVGYLLYVLKR